MKITFSIDEKSVEPVYAQLAAVIAAAIDEGRMAADSPLPSSRDLADSLSLSRDTVVNAYGELKRLAYVASDRTRGTYVLPRAQRSTQFSSSEYEAIEPERLSDFGRRILEAKFTHPSSPSFAALNFGAVPKSALPIRRWRTLMQQMCEPGVFKSLEYTPDILGRAELRKALAAYLLRTKDIHCDWQQVAIFSVSSGLISVLSKMLLDPGAVVAVEEPGYGVIKNLAASQNLTVLPVPVDRDGMRVEELKKYPGCIKMVYLTAGHHDPTGVILSPERRQNLLQWAGENDVWVLEDDYDGQFYHGVEKPPTLWSAAPDANVIYSATFWQILYPLTTVGYAVIPKPLLAAVSAGKELQTEGISDFIRQLILAQMIESGYLEKHLRKIGKIFSSRRIAATLQLKKLFGPAVEISTCSAGNYFTISLPGWDVDVVEAAAAEAQLPLQSTRAYYLEKPRAGEYLINFALLPEEEMAQRLGHFSRLLGQK